MFDRRQSDADQSSSALPNILFILTFIYFFLSIALVRAMVMGVPLRSLLGLFIFCTIYILIPKLLLHAVWETRRVIYIITYAAFLGLIVSLFNAAPVDVVIRQIIEIHFQAIIGLLTGYGLLRVIGPNKLGIAFISVVGISCVFAVLQAVGVDFAWTVRDTLQKYQAYDLETVFLNTRMRAMGLSFSPVHLGTQICLAFAVAHMLRVIKFGEKLGAVFHMKAANMLAIALLIAIASGNRSPILGLFGFMAAYIFYLRPSIAIALSILIFPLATAILFNLESILEYLQQTGIRAFRVGDKSSEGREALRAFGWLLFMHQPLGYGLTFKSIEHVAPFWSELIHYENAETVFGNAIHNYYLNLLHKYGLFIIPIAAFPIFAFFRSIHVFLAFLPYAIHIFFHNDGPLQGDFLIWYFLPLAIVHLKNRPQYQLRKT